MAKPDLDQIAAILKDVTGRAFRLEDDTNIARSLDLDSLTIANFVMALEDAYDVSIPLDRVEQMETAGDVVRTIGQIQMAAA